MVNKQLLGLFAVLAFLLIGLVITFMIVNGLCHAGVLSC